MKPFDEMLQSGDMGAPYARLKQWLDTQNPASLAQKAYDAEGVFRKTALRSPSTATRRPPSG